MASLSETASDLGAQIGRYFSLTSLLPSVLFLSWGCGLVALKPGFGATPDLGEAARRIGEAGLGEAGALLVVSLLLAVTLQPLAFATVQLMEGYWGTHPLALRLAALKAGAHRRRLQRLETTAERISDDVRERVETAFRASGSTSPPTQEDVDFFLGTPDGLSLHSDFLTVQSLLRARESYPVDAHRVMPTRLGNALRRPEDRAGFGYGLNIRSLAPHLAVSAAPERVAYIKDIRQELDLAVRICSLALVSSVLTLGWLCVDGWWTLLSAVPYAIAWLSYRGAISSAREWGVAMSTALDLDRFALYRALHLPDPSDTVEERAQNAAMLRLLAGDDSALLSYRGAGETGRG